MSHAAVRTVSRVETGPDAADHSVDDPLEAIVCLIHEAALDTRKWKRVAESISDFLGGHSIFIRLQMPEPVGRAELYRSDSVELSDSVFAKLWRAGLPWGNAIASDGRMADIRDHFVDHDGLLTESQLTQTPFYREWMAPRGLAPMAPIVHVFGTKGDAPMAAVTVYNKAGLAPITSGQIEDLDRLVPHLRIAQTALDTLRSLENEHMMFSELIDRLPTGIILIDETGMIGEMNEAARIALQNEDGLRVVDGRLLASSSDCNEWLQGVIERARSPRFRARLEHDERLDAHRAAWNAGVPLIVSPLQLPPSDTNVPDTVAVVFVGNLQLSEDAAIDALRGLYQLTPAEAELTWLLASGLSLEQAAEARGVTLNTARSQLKRVFAKTGSKKQSDLVRLVLGGVAALRAKS